MSEHKTLQDALGQRSGRYGEWLLKAKTGQSRFSLSADSVKRYFTLDFDMQMFYYSHTEKREKVNSLVKFTDIIFAERLPHRCNGFTLKTIEHNLELYTSQASDALTWIDALNTGRDLAKGADLPERATSLNQDAAASKTLEPGSRGKCHSTLEDAVGARTGRFSAWLLKGKSEKAKTRLLSMSDNARRYFTLDFDSQSFYYSHSERRENICGQLKFGDIANASALPNQPNGFLLKTPSRDYYLYTMQPSDVRHWVGALNLARDIVVGHPSESDTQQGVAIGASVQSGGRRKTLKDLMVAKSGNYGAWLLKAKTGKAMLSSDTVSRYFTLDFDAQCFYYSHTEGREKMNSLVKFSEIADVAKLPNCPNGLVLTARGKHLTLYAPQCSDAPLWIESLKMARDHVAWLLLCERSAIRWEPCITGSERNGNNNMETIAMSSCSASTISGGSDGAITVESTIDPTESVNDVESICHESTIPRESTTESVIESPNEVKISDGDIAPTLKIDVFASTTCCEQSTVDFTDPFAALDALAVAAGPSESSRAPEPLKARHSANHAELLHEAMLRVTRQKKSFETGTSQQSLVAPRKQDFALLGETWDAMGSRTDAETTAGSDHPDCNEGSRTNNVQRIHKQQEQHPLVELAGRCRNVEAWVGGACTSETAQTSEMLLGDATQRKSTEINEWDFDDADKLVLPQSDPQAWREQDRQPPAPPPPPPPPPPQATAPACLAQRRKFIDTDNWDLDDASGEKSLHSSNEAVEVAVPRDVRQPPLPVSVTKIVKPGPRGELDDLLGEVMAVDVPPPQKSQPGAINSELVDNYHCIGCDKQVLGVMDAVWTDDVEYLFVRNFYPKADKLKKQLRKKKGWIAYCCQCSWKSASKDESLEEVAVERRWRLISA
jgi:hypothetical protein